MASGSSTTTPSGVRSVAERCGYCGRFMKHTWYLTGEHDCDWQDYWACSQDAQHKVDHPSDWH